MKYRVRHTTAYFYSEPVSLCHNELHLRPRENPRQTCRESELTIRPEPASMSERVDFFGNHIAYFTLQERHQRLEVGVISEVEVSPFTPPMHSLTPPWEDVRDRIAEDATAHFEAIQFLYESAYVKPDEPLAAYARESFTPRRSLLEAAVDLTARIFRDFKYDTAATNVQTEVAEVFQIRRGVCQDFAHVLLGCLRALGLPSRYVSGYLLTTPAPGKEKLVGADASHAWVSIYCPGFGWIDLDPTNNLIPSDKHVTLAWGRDYADVTPIKGVILGGGQHTIRVNVDVSPI